MQRKKKLTFLIYSLTIFFMLSSCMPEKKRRVIIVLIDYSASSASTTLDKFIKTIDEDIFANMDQYDYLAVLPIDDGSKREPVKIIDEDLVEKKFTKKTDGFAHAQDSLKGRLDSFVVGESPKIAEILKSQREERKIYTGHTDIIGALQQTPNLIEVNTKDKDVKTKLWDFIVGHNTYKRENIIVLLSDMIHNAEDFSFNSNKKVTSKQYQNYLQQLKQQDKIPDLQNCKIFVIGVTGINSTQIDRIAIFWKDYFKLTNGELKAYGFSVEDKLRKYLKEERN